MVLNYNKYSTFINFNESHRYFDPKGYILHKKNNILTLIINLKRGDLKYLPQGTYCQLN